MYNMSYVVTIMWKLHVNIVGVGFRVGDWRGMFITHPFHSLFVHSSALSSACTSSPHGSILHVM